MPALIYDLRGQSPAIPPDSLVLVTGVSGLIGGHVADKLLMAGYRVRGTTRSAAGARWTTDHFTRTYGPGRFELVEIADMSSPEAYDAALHVVHGVVHVASDLSLNDNAEEVIPPTLKHIRTILEAAAAQSSVARFVYTSSATALTNPKPGERKKITVADWNDAAVASAQSKDPELAGYTVYAASKTLGEREVWKFARDDRRQLKFTVNTILPNLNLGRLVAPEQNQSTSLAVDWIWEAKKANTSNSSLIPPQWFVDVEDTALLHVAALIDPAIRYERILGFAEPFNWSKILNTWKRIVPHRDWGDVIVDEDEDRMEIPNQRGAGLLRRFEENGVKHRGWTTLEQSLRRRLESDRTFGRK